MRSFRGPRGLAGGFAGRAATIFARSIGRISRRGRGALGAFAGWLWLRLAAGDVVANSRDAEPRASAENTATLSARATEISFICLSRGKTLDLDGPRNALFDNAFFEIAGT